MNQNPLLSVIVPVYNEEGNLPILYKRLRATIESITNNYEIIWVNDGSHDRSPEIVKQFAAENNRCHYINFSRNFGHQPAIMAGLDYCSGSAVITIDGDLQDPPELITEMWNKYREGNKVVYAQRKKRAGEHPLRNWTIKVFYRLLKRTTSINIPVDTGDYRLIDRKVVDALKQMPEQHKFLRGQIAWIGYKQAPVFYDRDSRYAGKSNYGLFKLIKLALDGFTAFSNYPLRIATFLGFIVSFIAFLVILYALYSKFILRGIISGWTSLIISTMFIGGVQLITIGIIGEYINRINSDVRKRPLYIVEDNDLTGKTS
jgi:glycosyltransferase involved in cell wall biosynthesis